MDTPCFDYLAIYSVSNVKNPFAQRFKLILFVSENFCNCASHRKFGANEFFKHTYKISIFRLHKRIFDDRK